MRLLTPSTACNSPQSVSPKAQNEIPRVVVCSSSLSGARFALLPPLPALFEIPITTSIMVVLLLGKQPGSRMQIWEQQSFKNPPQIAQFRLLILITTNHAIGGNCSAKRHLSNRRFLKLACRVFFLSPLFLVEMKMSCACWFFRPFCIPISAVLF
uniref:Uncharacterized protein n=1 Tax=Mesocestoides corti TaxID=53468 RepID=A0A5K3FTE8_MESCO